MRLLLDTHVAIWWLSGDRRLTAPTRVLIEQAADAFLSSVSLWELVLKVGLGRLVMPDGFDNALRDDFSELPLTFDHVLESRTLPPLHRDPFDRILVAQARLEGLRLVTGDHAMAAYGIAILRP